MSDGAFTMSVHKRRDSGAWEVSINGVRQSSRSWTRKDAIEHERHKAANAAGQYTLDDALDRWARTYVPRLRSARQITEHLRIVRRFTPGIDLKDAGVASRQIREASMKLAPATVNQRLAILHRVCVLAYKEWGWLREPVDQRIAMMSVHNERHVYLTRAQVEGLAQSCSHLEAKQLIVFSAFTGLRLSELFRARSTDVWNGALRLDARTKNSKPRSIPLHPRALCIAEQLPLAITRPALRAEWERARTKQHLEHVHWHDLRHTFASWCLAAGARLPELKELMGHQTIEMTMRYAHLTPNATRTIIERI